MVIRAKHLPNRRKLDKQSPYVVARIGTVAKNSGSISSGQTPEWTHEMRFELSRERKPILKLMYWMKRKMILHQLEMLKLMHQ